MKRLLLIGVVLAGLLAACGGGGGSSGGLPPSGGSSATPTPTATPTATPATSGSGTAGVSTSASTNFTLPPVGGYAGTVTFPAATVSTTLTVADSTTPQNGVAVQGALRRAIQTWSTVSPESGTSNTAMVYISVTAAASTSLTGSPALTFTLPSPNPTGPFYLASYTNGQWETIAGPGVVSGATVTFAGTTGNALALAAGTPFYLAFYTGGVIPTPTPSPSPSPTPTATVSPSPSPTSSASPGGNLANNACLQTPNPAVTPGLAQSASTFFSTIIPNAHTICISAWDLSSNIDSALASALHNGANVWVITPSSQSNTSEEATLASEGAIIDLEYTTAASPAPAGANYTSTKAPMDIHSKFALINGQLYMDGHNWFTQDVILADGYAGDYAAAQADLVSFPTPPPGNTTTNPTFTTDKYLSLDNEATYISNANPGSGTTLDFVSEDFEDYGAPAVAVYGALIKAAQNGATVNVVVEGPITGSAAVYEQCDLWDLQAAGGHAYTQTAGGAEKITLISNQTSAWFGSSNMSDDDLFDWGMVISDPAVISALQTNFNMELNEATSYPTPAPQATATPCEQ